MDNHLQGILIRNKDKTIRFEDKKIDSKERSYSSYPELNKQGLPVVVQVAVPIYLFGNIAFNPQNPILFNYFGQSHRVYFPLSKVIQWITDNPGQLESPTSDQQLKPPVVACTAPKLITTKNSRLLGACILYRETWMETCLFMLKTCMVFGLPDVDKLKRFLKTLRGLELQLIPKLIQKLTNGDTLDFAGFKECIITDLNATYKCVSHAKPHRKKQIIQVDKLIKLIDEAISKDISDEAISKTCDDIVNGIKECLTQLDDNVPSSCCTLLQYKPNTPDPTN